MTTLPTDCHQVAAAFALSPRQPLLCRVVALSTSFGVALLQVVVLMAAARAPKERSCLTNDDCDTRATYCRPSIKQCDSCSFGYGGACMPNVTAEAWIASQPVDLLSGQNGGTVARTFPRALDYASHCAACVAADGRYGWMSDERVQSCLLYELARTGSAPSSWRASSASSARTRCAASSCARYWSCGAPRSASASAGGLGCPAWARFASTPCRDRPLQQRLHRNLFQWRRRSRCAECGRAPISTGGRRRTFAHAVPEEAKARWAALAAVRINAAEARIISWVKLASSGSCPVHPPRNSVALRFRTPEGGSTTPNA